MNWGTIVQEIKELGFEIVKGEIKLMRNEIIDFNVEIKGNTFGDRYLIQPINGTLDQMDGQYLLFYNLAKIKCISSILKDWYEENK